MSNKENPAVKAPNRRQILGTMGLVGAGVVLGACTPAMSQSGTTKPNIDAAVLNFALNLEYLEAAFYSAAVGRLADFRALGGGSAEIRLPSGFDGSQPIPGLTGDVLAYAQEIAQDELNHVKFLRGALKTGAVDRPVLDLGKAFADAGDAASGGALMGGFNPFANPLFFLHGAFIFEDVGVTAYKGAAPLITDAGYLEAAAGILAVEAYHSGEIRTLLYQQRNQPTAAGLNVAQTVEAIAALRQKAGTVPDKGITDDGTATGKANIVLADENSIAYSRSTTQVLSIVSLGSPGNKGGFFPNGLNGTIK